MHDLFVDLTCEYDTIKISGQDVKVHSGMYKSAVNLTDPAHPTSVFLAVKSALTKHEGYGLLLTGHSLGAAIASYLALIWGDENTCSTRENSGLPLGRLVKCFAFGPPCVVSLNGSKLLKKLVTSITVESDLVCRLSLGSAIDMLNIAKWMNRNRNVADPIISAIFKQKEIKCTPELIQTRISVEAQFAKEEKLFPAGELYYIDQKEICRVDRIDVLFGILILSNGINKHMPNYYDGLFKDM